VAVGQQQQQQQRVGSSSPLPGSEPGQGLLEFVAEEQIQGFHAVLQSHGQLGPQAPGGGQRE